MGYAERAIIEEAQRRREQLITYLQQVSPSSDEQTRTVIALLKERMANDSLRLAALH